MSTYGHEFGRQLRIAVAEGGLDSVLCSPLRGPA